VAIAVTLARGGLEIWTAGPNPVFVVVYDVASETAYWTYSRDAAVLTAVAQVAGGTFTIRIPMENRLSAEAVTTIHGLKSVHVGQDRRGGNP
jgi:hypothetical protein